MYAIVENGVVKNMVSWDGRNDWSPLKGDVVEAPDNVTIGWRYINGIFQKPIEPPKYTNLEQAKTAKVAEVTEKRKSIEFGGYSINGFIFHTEKEDQSNLATKATIANTYKSFFGNEDILNQETEFKTKSGFVTLSVGDLVMCGLLIGGFVQDCYVSEGRHTKSIEKLKTIDEVLSYKIDSNWPSNEVLNDSIKIKPLE